MGNGLVDKQGNAMGVKNGLLEPFFVYHNPHKPLPKCLFYCEKQMNVTFHRLTNSKKQYKIKADSPESAH